MAVLPGVRSRSRRLRPVGPLLRRAGSLVFVAAALGCGGASGDDVPSADAALRDTLGITLRDDLHRVAVGGERDMERVFPDTVAAAPGDFVAFETVDGRIHRISFDTDSISAQVRRFLEGTRQLESPPLIDRGTRFLLDLTDAPEGRYVFRAWSAGDPVWGVVRVGMSSPARSSR